MNDNSILSIFEDVFEKESPKLCLFDTVISMPAVKLPFIELTQLCKKYNVLSLIDGAHSVGLIPLDLKFQPDFFVSNLHKWLYVPRGCAILYVDKDHWRQIQTMPISHSYLDDDAVLSEENFKNLLVDKFTNCGTKFFAHLETIESAISFREKVCGGEENIYKYSINLAFKVGETISKKWGTSYMDNEDSTLMTAMVNVEIPLAKVAYENNMDITNLNLTNPKVFASFFTAISNYNIVEDKTYVPIVFHNSKLYARFSCQVYNELDDYIYAADALLSSVVEHLPFFASILNPNL